MVIGRTGYYVIKAMLFFAFSQKRSLSIKELSPRLGISPKVMEQVLLLMKKAGFLTSKRGPRGGYSLVKDPANMSIMEVLERTGQNIEVLPYEKKTVPIDDVMSDMSRKARKEIVEFFRKTKIKDLTAQMIGKVAEKTFNYTI